MQSLQSMTKKNKETGAFTLEYMFVKVGWACGKLNKF